MQKRIYEKRLYTQHVYAFMIHDCRHCSNNLWDNAYEVFFHDRCELLNNINSLNTKCVYTCFLTQLLSVWCVLCVVLIIKTAFNTILCIQVSAIYWPILTHACNHGDGIVINTIQPMWGSVTVVVTMSHVLLRLKCECSYKTHPKIAIR